MAYPFQQSEGLTREQAEILRELNSFKQVSESAAWVKIKEKIQSMVDEAKEDLLGCPPDTCNEGRSILSIRWQQREAMSRELTNFVESQLQERNILLVEIKEQENGDTDDHSGDPGSNDQ
jgi:DNA-directed RNA polymerase subunit F